MNRYQRLGCWIGLAGLALPGGCGSSGGADRTPVTAAITRYYTSLRQGDLQGVRAALAPEYRFDRGAAFLDPGDPFDAFLGIRYSALDVAIQTVTIRGDMAEAMVRISFQGTLNLETEGVSLPLPLVFLDRPRVEGTAADELELQRQGQVWRLTAVRVVRRSYRPVSDNAVGPILADFRVNSQTAVQVAPGAPLTLTGTADQSEFVIGLIGDAMAGTDIDFGSSVPWSLQLRAPETPGRYLAHVLSLNCAGDCVSDEKDEFRDGEQLTIPVTVTQTAAARQ